MNRMIVALVVLLIGLVPTFVGAATCIIPNVAENGYDYDAARDKFGKNDSAKVDYFKLAITWSGSHCDQKRNEIAKLEKKGKHDEAEGIRKKNALQCFSQNKFGWILHGLWGQTCKGKKLGDCKDWKQISSHPRLCKGDLPEVEYKELKNFLCQSPGTALLQGEWEKHGACSYATPSEYFAKQAKLYDDFKYPSERMSGNKVLKWMVDNNAALKGKTLQMRGSEFYICYDNDFRVFNCPPPEK